MRPTHLLSAVVSPGLLISGLLITGLACAAVAATADEIKPKRHRKNWRAVTVPITHLVLRDGRAFYRGPGHLNDQYPYFLAANAAERGAGFGYQLRMTNAHQLLAPIETAAAAREFARVLSGGVIVPDEAAYTLLRAEALRLKPVCTGWGVEVEDGRPGCFGVGVEKTADGFTVRALVFKCSSYHRLEVQEQTWTLPASGALRRDVKSWIMGPPQAWQTAGDVDMAEERRLCGEVTRFRAAFLKVLGAGRTLDAVKKALEGNPTFAVVRDRLGEPDGSVGGGREQQEFAYRLRDGTAVVITVARRGGDDLAPLGARHVASLAVSDDGTLTVGKTLARIAARE